MITEHENKPSPVDPTSEYSREELAKVRTPECSQFAFIPEFVGDDRIAVTVPKKAPLAIVLFLLFWPIAFGLPFLIWNPLGAVTSYAIAQALAASFFVMMMLIMFAMTAISYRRNRYSEPIFELDLASRCILRSNDDPIPFDRIQKVEFPETRLRKPHESPRVHDPSFTQMQVFYLGDGATHAWSAHACRYLRSMRKLKRVLREQCGLHVESTFVKY